MKILTMVLVFLSVLWTANALAQSTVTAPAPMVEAEVRKVDKEAQKLTLRHGPIPNLEMPSMTMVFRVTDPSVLGRLSVGDKVRFRADKVDGQYTVTAIEAAK